MSNKEYGLVGGALGHSFSPRIHAELGDYGYELFPMDEETFDKFFTEKDFLGVNVTIPYKKRVIPFLDEITPQAASIGAVNTVVCRGNKLHGTNTDYLGFLYMAKRAGIDFAGKKVMVLGDGGAAVTAIAAAKDEGAREVLVVSLFSDELNFNNMYEHNDVEIIINATPVGMYPKNGERIADLSRFPKCVGVLDVIYNPLRTALILDALERGIPCASGLSMLVTQAAYANEFFFDRPLPKEKIDEVLYKIERESMNISLIGMPGCGKSSIGKIVADMLGMQFVDADDEITKTAGRTPAEIINEDGEAAFRDIETKVLSELGKTGGKVISCGGGVIVREENYPHLKQNGDIFYIKRDLSKLERSGRPLSAGDGAIEKLFAARKDKYERFADHTVENDSDIATAAEKIADKFTKGAF